MNRPYSKQGNSEGVWLARIRNARAQLSKSEARVADWALAEPEQFVNSPIQHIAQSAQVSQPTVIRFCRSMGCDGLQDFKIKLSGSLSGESAVQFEALSADDSVADIANKVLGNTASALLTLRQEVCAQAIEQAMQRLQSARRVDVFGLGSSAPVADDVNKSGGSSPTGQTGTRNPWRSELSASNAPPPKYMSS